MSPALRGNFKMAWAGVRASKWRSFLTTLGLIIGVASVVTVVGLGEGVKHQIEDQITQLGRDLITVRAGQVVQRDANGRVAGASIFSGTNLSGFGALTENDLNAVQRTEGVRTAVPITLVNGTVKVNQNEFSPTVLGTTNQLPEVLGRDVEHGAFFDEDTIATPHVAVIGAGVAKQLYQQRVPLGQTFDFLGHTFYVRGVFAPFDTPPLSLNADFNNAIFIPERTAEALTAKNAQIYEILAKPADPEKTDQAVTGISKSLQSARQGQQQFSVLRQDEGLAATNQVLDLLTRLIAGVAAISLLVGGIGIMNVMLVSVAERMHEIGIRKALGATNRQILGQFMAESIVISAVGGFLGVVVAFVAIFLIDNFSSYGAAMVWPVAGGAFLVAVAIGVIFGTAPALKAARKDPITALRNE
jgi:ABC-type antimicrobial peptide transport system permease subunit